MLEEKDHRRMEKQHCPKCDYLMDAYSAPFDPKEKECPEARPEDITFCLNCAAILKFDGEMKIIELTKEDREFISNDPILYNKVRRLQMSILSVIIERKNAQA